MKRTEMYEGTGAVPFFEEESGCKNERLAKIVKKIIAARLPKRQRQVIVLYYYYGMKQREIAKRLKISPSAVSQYKKAALEQLQFYLEIENT